MKRKIRFLSVLALLALLLLAAPLAAADAPRTTAPEDVGMSASRLARIGAHMQSYVDADEIPGAMALVARKGEIVYLDSWGWADRENRVPMRPDTIFRIYAMSKPITSVALMILHEEGHFLLSDPVAKYLPELGEPQVMLEETNEATGEKTVKPFPARRSARLQRQSWRGV